MPMHIQHTTIAYQGFYEHSGSRIFEGDVFQFYVAKNPWKSFAFNCQPFKSTHTRAMFLYTYNFALVDEISQHL